MNENNKRKLRGTWAEIDLKRYLYNINKAAELSNSNIIAIVKADGYGHGADYLSNYLLNNSNITRFAVATVEEAISLRKSIGSSADIIILGYVDKTYFSDIKQNNIILTIFDEESAELYHNFLSFDGTEADVYLKINTGMNRIGFDNNFDFENFATKYKYFNIKMVMSHLAQSDNSRDYTELQFNLFDEFIKKYRIKIPTSLFNSAAIINYKNKFDFSRPGILSYGYVDGGCKYGIKPVMKVFSTIVHIKKIRKGENVSYGGTFIADRDMKIAVLPIGYADGYSRIFSNRSSTFINEIECKIVGRVCMDMTLVDITNIPERFYETPVEIIGDNISADKLSEYANTIPYEILCGISKRIPRIYV